MDYFCKDRLPRPSANTTLASLQPDFDRVGTAPLVLKGAAFLLRYLGGHLCRGGFTPPDSFWVCMLPIWLDLFLPYSM